MSLKAFLNGQHCFTPLKPLIARLKLAVIGPLECNKGLIQSPSKLALSIANTFYGLFTAWIHEITQGIKYHTACKVSAFSELNVDVNMLHVAQAEMHIIL